MSLPSTHRGKTKKLVKAVDKKKIANWMLTEGFFPEQYVLPPCFGVEKFTLKKHPYFEHDKFIKNKIPIQETLEISFPKSPLTLRSFGIVYHKHYHDIVWHLCENWNEVVSQIFNSKNKIYSYSFPVPLNSQNIGSIGDLRAGRMIYEFIEMAENDIVSDAHRYKTIVRSDIKNFYPSVYTHSIPWALHGKDKARGDIRKFHLFGSKLDKLFQNTNDRCTNGIPIGPAISDLIAEIILSAVDHEISNDLRKANIDFIAVRFKDDYRFLCHSNKDAKIILKTLQKRLKQYNLTLNESKSENEILPEGLFRRWTGAYQLYTLLYKEKITYKRFESTYRIVLKIDAEYPGTGVIDKFLSELSSKSYNLKLKLKKNEIYKVFSLLLMLKERRPKSLPQILALTESIISNYSDRKKTIEEIYKSLNTILEREFAEESLNEYDIMWLTYFLKSHDQLTAKWPSKIDSTLLLSIKFNKQKFDEPTTLCKLFKKIEKPGANIKLLKHLAIFPKK